MAKLYLTISTNVFISSSMSVTNSKRIARNTGYLVLRMLIVFVVGLYTSRLILQYLGIEDFGLYNVVGSVVIFFSFFKWALNVSTSRYLSFEIGTGKTDSICKVFSMSINCHLILAVSLVIILESVGLWFLNTHLNIPNDRQFAANWVFQLSLVSFFFGIVFNPYNSAIIAYERMDYYAILSLVEALLKLAIVYCLAISPTDRLITYSFLLSCVSIILGLCNYLYCKRKFADCKYIRFWDKRLLKNFSSYSGWSLAVNTVDVCTNQGINICFNVFLGVVANASMGVATQVISHLCQFLSSFSQSYNPQIIKSYAAKQYGYFMDLVFSASKISYMILFFVCVPILLNIEFVLEIWLGEYPDMAPNYIKAIIYYYLIDATQAPLWQSVHATGNIKTHQIIMSCIKMITLPLVFFILKTGNTGEIALEAWAFVNLLCAVARIWLLKRLINLNIKDYLHSVVWKIIIVSVLAFPIPYYISITLERGWPAFMAVSSASCIISSIFIFFVGLNKRERDLILGITAIKKVLNLVHIYKD